MVVPNSNLKQNNFEYVQTLPTTKKYLKKTYNYKKRRLLLFHIIAKTKVASMNKKLIIYSPKKSSWTKNNHNYNDDDDGDDDGHFWSKKDLKLVGEEENEKPFLAFES